MDINGSFIPQYHHLFNQPHVAPDFAASLGVTMMQAPLRHDILANMQQAPPVPVN